MHQLSSVGSINTDTKSVQSSFDYRRSAAALRGIWDNFLSSCSYLSLFAGSGFAGVDGSTLSAGRSSSSLLLDAMLVGSCNSDVRCNRFTRDNFKLTGSQKMEATGGRRRSAGTNNRTHNQGSHGSHSVWFIMEDHDSLRLVCS
jgi:hypothetical protein